MMMQFFGTIVTKQDKVNLELDEGDIFNLTSAVIHPKSEGKGKVYLVAVVSLIEEDEMDNSDEEDEERDDEIEIPICVLEPGKTEQVPLNLHFNYEQIVRFELQGAEGSANAVALCGSVITTQAAGCEDEDCEDDQCGLSHEYDEEIDSDEEFGFESDEGVDQDDDEEIPQLIAPKKGNTAKITEIKAEPVAKQQPAKQQPAKQQPAKQAVSTPDKAAAAAPKQQPTKQAVPAKPQTNQSKNAPKQSPAKPQQQAAAKQSPAKPAENKKRQQPQNENNKKKSKN